MPGIVSKKCIYENIILRQFEWQIYDLTYRKQAKFPSSIRLRGATNQTPNLHPILGQ